MRAAVYHGAYDLRVEDVKDATVEQPGDVVLKTLVSSMCGSDLYLYGGEAEALAVGGSTVLARGARGVNVRQRRATRLPSHRVSLDGLPDAAAAFGQRDEGVFKVAIRP